MQQLFDIIMYRDRLFVVIDKYQPVGNEFLMPVYKAWAFDDLTEANEIRPGEFDAWSASIQIHTISGALWPANRRVHSLSAKKFTVPACELVLLGTSHQDKSQPAKMNQQYAEILQRSVLGKTSAFSSMG